MLKATKLHKAPPHEEQSRLRPKIIPTQNVEGEKSHYLYRLRQSTNDSHSLISEIKARSQTFKVSFFFRTVQDWNCLPSEVKEITSKRKQQISRKVYSKKSYIAF